MILLSHEHIHKLYYQNNIFFNLSIKKIIVENLDYYP